MKVLVAYDGSACADAAVVNMRRAGIPENAEILVVTVVEAGTHPHSDPDFPYPAVRCASRTDLYEGHALADIAYKWIQTNFPQGQASRQVLVGSPATVILEKARSWHPDLLIVGSHGRSFAGRVLIGSVSQKLTREAPCSVRVVRANMTPLHGPLRIVIGNDGSAEAEVVLEKVAQRSWPENTEVRIVSVVETIVPVVSALEANAYASGPALLLTGESDEYRRSRLVENAKEAMGKFQSTGLIVTTAIVEGDPKRVLVGETDRWKADAIFLGARGLGRLEQILLGSVSNSILKHAHCAVEIVRGE
jgi:nucleotide-binding universal stress UspA family protein